MSDSINNRVFTDHGHYFTVVEESSWEGKYNPETKSLERGNPTGWTRTHIIPTVSCMKSENGTDYGLQILRFHGDSADGEWDLANNPYAGVYLKPDEWQKVMGKYDFKR